MIAAMARTRRKGGVALGVALALGGILGPGMGRAEDAKSTPAPAATPPAVGMDRLLKLPSEYKPDMETRGGATRAEWRERFQKARGEIDTTKHALESAQTKLEEAAADSSSPWRVSAPGAGTSTGESTERYPLTYEVKRQKEELERAERRLRDLDVEANLAGVPKDWRN
jgi:hypothetical protein